MLVFLDGPGCVIPPIRFHPRTMTGATLVHLLLFDGRPYAALRSLKAAKLLAVIDAGTPYFSDKKYQSEITQRVKTCGPKITYSVARSCAVAAYLIAYAKRRMTSHNSAQIEEVRGADRAPK